MKKFFLIFLSGIMACSSTSKIKKTTTIATTSGVSTEPVIKDTVSAIPGTDTLAMASMRVPGITAERLAEGRKIYMQDCTRCHSMKEPSNYTPQQWEPILVKMFVNAKLTDEHEKALIHDYVIARSK
ncbi:MAG: hypothetical protein ABJA57_01140 [Ginsengibacter sp.]